eukprot:TRINITY_DN4393_c0_g1_i1.p1 TRINITY_DN4393_c0_g1~~TRINITY_DN4393_c0_g1_i1.p1  ORF type:complete len:746 (+),score=195.21 TRINITY_DN4393_c0_g1_i1:46-2238(+)
MEAEEGLVRSRTKNSFKNRILRNSPVLTLISVLVVGILLLIVSIAIFSKVNSISGLQNGGDTTGEPSTGDVPPSSNENPALRELSQVLLSAVDFSADPCDDFFQYSCGNWIETTTLPSDRSSFSRFSQIDDQNKKILKEVLEEGWPIIGNFYQSCMNMDTINSRGSAPLAPYLATADALTDMNSLAAILGQLHHVDGGILFAISVELDSKDPTYYIPAVYQAGIGLPNRNYYLDNDTDTLATREAYQTHVANILKLVGVANFESAAAAIVTFETQLAVASMSEEEMRDPNAVYHLKTGSELQQMTPNFNWPVYFQNAGFNFTINKLNVAMPDYVAAMYAIVERQFSSDSQVLKNYFKWRVATALASLLSQDFLDEMFAWQQAFLGTKAPKQRYQTCVSASDNYLGELLGRYYVQKAFGGTSKQIAQSMVDALEDAMSADIDGLDWMDTATKIAAKAKLRAITNKIGYPDVWEDYSALLLADDTYFENVLKAAKLSEDTWIQRVYKPVVKTNWGMSPPTVNAYYSPSDNEIVFPAGILQSPGFSSSNPAWANFGAVGSVIGHEISHGFDDQGRLFAGNGSLTDWWTASSSAAFLERTQCIIDQYNNYEVLPGLFINGVLTQGENIADIGGLRISHAAYKNWIDNHGEGHSVADMKRYFPDHTTDQLFFVSYAQVWCSKATDNYIRWLTLSNEHSWGKFRVIGGVSNNEAFWDAFKCEAGTKMHPEKTCKVW